MNNHKFVSIKTILYDIVKYPFTEGIQTEDIALYLTNLLSLVGSPFIFNKKVDIITIKNYKAPLPCDLIQIEGTRYKLNCNNCKFIPLKWASNIYHSSMHCQNCPDLTCDSEYSYSLNNGYIYTSFEEGEVQMAYLSISTDDEGFPMIPDNTQFKQALKYYILWQYAEPSYYRGEVTDKVYNDIKQQYAWYVGAATNAFNMPSMDRMESMKNGLVRLFQGMDHHSQFWNNFNKKEIFRQ